MNEEQGKSSQDPDMCTEPVHHVKTVLGRTSDWNDAQWLQKLHALGLLQASFRPDAEIRTLHTLVRYRAELIERRAPHINHMIQALKHKNIQLNLVLTDITGVTGLAMLRAIVAGEPDAPLPQLAPTKPNSKNDSSFNARAQIARVAGVDLVAVMAWLKLYSSCIVILHNVTARAA